MTSKRNRVSQILQDRSQAIVDGWYGVVTEYSLSAVAPAECRQLLSRLFERVVAFLLDEEIDTAEARAIGEAFVPLRLGAGAFGGVVGVVAQHLLLGLPVDLAAALGPRLADLVEGLTAGFTRGDRESILDQQERLRDAYMRALRRAEAELLLRDAGIESSINAICFSNPEGQVTYVNPAFLSLWGYVRREDVVGRHVGEFGNWEYDPSVAIEALEAEDGWIGELVAWRKDGSPVDVQVSASTVRDEAGRLLQIMSSFVDITERRRAQETLQRRVAQMTVLNRIGDRIAGLLAPNEVLETAVRLVQETFDYHQVAVLTLDKEHRELVVGAIAGAVEGDTPSKHRVPIGKGITGWVARHGEPLVVNDVDAEPRYLERFRREVPTRSELAVPIESADGLIGVLDVQSPRREAFGDADRIALEILADQIAVALENARLYDALQHELIQRTEAETSLRRNLERLATLHEIDQAILAAKSMEEVAEAALHHLRRLVPCQRASIDLFDYQAGELIVLAAIQTIGRGLAGAGARFPLTQREFTQSLFERRQYVHVEDVQQLPQSAPFIQAIRAEGLRSFVAAPIRSGGELIGMIGLGADRLAGFEPEHGPIVKEVADSVAVAIQQARLLDSVRQQGERLRDTMARLAEAEEAERRRVVQTLHDRVGQNLTALDLNLSLVRSQLHGRDLQDLCFHLDDALSLLEQTSERIRLLMAELRPPVLDDYGLLATLRWYAETFSSRTGIEVTVCGEQEAASDLLAHVENALLRIAQEALHNTAKHAEATEATVDLSTHGAGVQLTISDNGIGFEPEEGQSDRRSWGLLTMRERAESVGARCFIESEPNRGARVVIEVPR